LAGEALEYLVSSIHHRGTLYPATPAGVPFAARLLLASDNPRPVEFAYLLWAIAVARDARPPVMSAVRDALTAQAEPLTGLLDAPDDELRQTMPLLLANLPAEAASTMVEAFLARLRIETSDLVLASLLCGLARLDPAACADRVHLDLAADRPLGVRAGAVWAFLEAGFPWTQQVTDTIAELWRAGDPLPSLSWYQDSELREFAAQLQAPDELRGHIRRHGALTRP
jgi:hypothetical protein